MDKAAARPVRLARTLLQSSAAAAASRQSSSRLLRTAATPEARRPGAEAMVSRPVLVQLARPFSSTAAARAADERPPAKGTGMGSIADALSSLGSASSPADSSRTSMDGLADLLSPSSSSSSSSSSAAAQAQASSAPATPTAATTSSSLDDLHRMKRDADHSAGEFQFHVFSHKHNTHITVSKPNGDVILSVSCGNIGFRKAQRKSYDAAYQLGAYVCDRLYQAGWHKSIHKMAVFLRGFGQGRQAVTKILLGTEGRLLRGKITRVADSTPLKYGGTRSQNPRRL